MRLAIAIISGLFWSASLSHGGAPGVALLIANAVDDTASPAQDLRALARSLREQGYTAVVRDSVPNSELRHTVEKFITAIPTHGVALLYFSGNLSPGKSDGDERLVLQGIELESDKAVGLPSRAIGIGEIHKLFREESAAAVSAFVIDGAKASGVTLPQSEATLFCLAGNGFAKQLAASVAAAGGDLQPSIAVAASRSGARVSDVGESRSARIEAVVSGPTGLVAGDAAGDLWVNSIGCLFCWCPGTERTPGFWLGKFEVTKREFDLVTRVSPRGALASSSAHPRDSIRYDDIRQFVDQLNWAERLFHQLPDDWEYALPSEEEWEYACRAGTETDFSFGDQVEQLAKHANFADRRLHDAGDDDYRYAERRFDDGAAKLAAVGRYPANAWGFHDMHGNLWEWTSTLAPALNPAEPPEPIARGGSWVSLPGYCRADFRHQFERTSERDFIGFRLAIRRVGSR